MHEGESVEKDAIEYSGIIDQVSEREERKKYERKSERNMRGREKEQKKCID